MGIIKNALIYLGFVEDELQNEIASYEDPSAGRVQVRPQRQPLETLEPRSGPDSKQFRVVPQDRPLASVHHLTPRNVPVGQVHIVRPASYGDAQQIGDRLRRALPVIVNLQEVEDELYHRVVAFASGLVYGLDGNIQKLSKRIYLITPGDMQVSSEDKRRLAEESSLGF